MTKLKKAVLMLWLKYRIYRVKKEYRKLLRIYNYFNAEFERRKKTGECIPGHLRRNEAWCARKVREANEFVDEFVKRNPE